MSLKREISKKSKNCPFIKSYFNKEFLKPVLERIPVYILDNTDLGLDGCFIMAKIIINKLFSL